MAQSKAAADILSWKTQPWLSRWYPASAPAATHETRVAPSWFFFDWVFCPSCLGFCLVLFRPRFPLRFWYCSVALLVLCLCRARAVLVLFSCCFRAALVQFSCGYRVALVWFLCRSRAGSVQFSGGSCKCLVWADPQGLANTLNPVHPHPQTHTHTTEAGPNPINPNLQNPNTSRTQTEVTLICEPWRQPEVALPCSASQYSYAADPPTSPKPDLCQARLPTSESEQYPNPTDPK